MDNFEEEFNNNPELHRFLEPEHIESIEDQVSITSSSSGSRGSRGSRGSSDSELIEYNVPIIPNNALLINTTINNNEILLMIDTSCDKSFLPLEYAEKLNLSNNNHVFDIKDVKTIIETDVFYFDFIIDEDKGIPTLGLDNLKKYNSLINFHGNYLQIGTQSTLFKTINKIEKLIQTDNYNNLIKLGFESDKILEALSNTNNNFNDALNILVN